MMLNGLNKQTKSQNIQEYGKTKTKNESATRYFEKVCRGVCKKRIVPVLSETQGLINHWNPQRVHKHLLQLCKYCQSNP